jgi:hypothetical protein
MNIAARIIHKLFFLHQYYLLYDLGGAAPQDFARFQELVPSKDRFWADPLVVCRDGRCFLFIEEYFYRRGRGRLAVMELDSQGVWSQPVSILEKPYHLSYPFVFECEGVTYLVPESAENQTIDLYECVDFPTQWRHKKTLMEGVLAVDSTLLRWQERWWLFTGIAQEKKALPFVELHLFYTDDLLCGEWRPHPMNPVIPQVACARPAGRLFIRDGKLIRPAQNCTKMYGYGIDFYEITVLTKTEYAETKMASIQPGWEPKVLATHTYSQDGSLTVIDALQKRWKWG